jgi:hypothetical protein
MGYESLPWSFGIEFWLNVTNGRDSQKKEIWKYVAVTKFAWAEYYQHQRNHVSYKIFRWIIISRRHGYDSGHLLNAFTVRCWRNAKHILETNIGTIWLFVIFNRTRWHTFEVVCSKYSNVAFISCSQIIVLDPSWLMYTTYWPTVCKGCIYYVLLVQRDHMAS